jgi:hypothetical protein
MRNAAVHLSRNKHVQYRKLLFNLIFVSGHISLIVLTKCIGTPWGCHLKAEICRCVNV